MSPPGPLGETVAKKRGPWRTIGIVALALAIALLGGVVGGLVARQSNTADVTVLKSDGTPGAAVLPNGVGIPTLVDHVLPSIVSIDAKGEGSEDQGTGMIISSDGMVITNNHVIAVAASGGSITVTRSGSTSSLSASLIGRDPSNDVALIKIQGVSGLAPVVLGNSNKVVVGDAAVAIGNALGLAAGTPTVTSGIISALGRTVTATDESGQSSETLNNMIQTDAAINPGNSGGPLLDSAGDVIGMNTAVASGSTGTSAQNIGFAIPASRIEALLPELEQGGTQVTTTGSYMGVDITTVTPSLRSQYGLVPTSGAVILNVVDNSPASAAGLKAGDVIVALDGKKITTAEDVITFTKAHQPGDKVQVTYQRGKLTATTTLTLGTPPS
jgi:putative serine protease PepD